MSCRVIQDTTVGAPMQGLGSLRGGILDFIPTIFAGAFGAGKAGSNTFESFAQGTGAQAAAADAQRRNTALLAVGLGVAGLAGVVYMLHSRRK